jgi:predicted RNA methylase
MSNYFDYEIKKLKDVRTGDLISLTDENPRLAIAENRKMAFVTTVVPYKVETAIFNHKSNTVMLEIVELLKEDGKVIPVLINAEDSIHVLKQGTEELFFSIISDEPVTEPTDDVQIDNRKTIKG